jgi:hypothetical protein
MLLINNKQKLASVGCAKRLYLRTVMAQTVRNLPLRTLHNGGILGAVFVFVGAIFRWRILTQPNNNSRLKNRSLHYSFNPNS